MYGEILMQDLVLYKGSINIVIIITTTAVIVIVSVCFRVLGMRPNCPS